MLCARNRSRHQEYGGKYESKGLPLESLHFNKGKKKINERENDNFKDPHMKWENEKITWKKVAG